MNIIGDTNFPKDGVYRIDNGNLILGQKRTIIIHNLYYFLADMYIYADRKIYCWGLLSLSEFEKKVSSGWVLCGVPEGIEIEAHHIGNFKAVNPSNYIDPNEFIKEVRDIMNLLSGVPTTSQLCRDAYEVYKITPTHFNREKLKIAYEEIPEHMKIYILGDMDLKDYPIRQIIY